MVVRDYFSTDVAELNAKIMRTIEMLVCRFSKSLPEGWQAVVEFENYERKEEYYRLILDGNKGNKNDGALKMMQTLKAFPKSICATGLLIADDVMHKFSVELMSGWEGYQKVLSKNGMTNELGGIRIPYEAFVTEHSMVGEINPGVKCEVKKATGEIRIAFCSEAESQNLFYAFEIFKRIQSILNGLWGKDQIWYNLRGLQEFQPTQFWLTALDIQEATL